MEIIIPGGTFRAKEGTGRTGYSVRVKQVTKGGFLPPFRCDSLTKGRFYLCGACFGTLGDGPATNSSEMWMCGNDRNGDPILEAGMLPIVPSKARCHKCGGRAWPSDQGGTA